MNNNRWLAAIAGAVVAYAIISSWPEIVRYRRMLAM
jgi:hypothetical protein